MLNKDLHAHPDVRGDVRENGLSKTASTPQTGFILKILTASPTFSVPLKGFFHVSTALEGV